MQEIYNHEDGSLNFTFLNNSGELKKFPDLKKHKLNEKNYYNPSLFPYLNHNTLQGSIFCNHIIPSAHYNIIGNKISLIEQNISLEDYIEKTYFLIYENICQILENNNKIILSFSGGIDSLVLLSFFENFNALEKIEIVNYENYFVDEHPDLLRNNNLKNNVLKDIEKYLKKKFHKIKITNEDWIYCLNNGSYTDIKAYCLSTILKKFPNHCIISGYFGDKTLLHDTIWIDQIFLNKPHDKLNFKKLTLDNSLYMNNFLEYDINKELISLQNYSFFMRTFSTFGNRLKIPLYTPSRLCRQIDVSTLQLHDVLDAKVARSIIYKNVKNNYSDFITYQGNFDGDTYARKNFKKTLIKDQIFEIPQNLNHDSNGLYWLSNLLKEDVIETNTLTCIKMLQFLNKILQSSK